MARSCEGFLTDAKTRSATEPSKAPDAKKTEAVALAFVQELLSSVRVHREGTVVTVHANVAAGLNALLAHYAKGVPQGLEREIQ